MHNIVMRNIRCSNQVASSGTGFTVLRRSGDSGIIVDLANDTDHIIYFNGCFVHLPNSLSKKYTRENIKTVSELDKWLDVIRNNQEKYQMVGYDVSYGWLTKLADALALEKQRLITVEQSVYITQSEPCPICLTTFQIGDNMISFHRKHQKHVCCLECFLIYNNELCPICRT